MSITTAVPSYLICHYAEGGLNEVVAAFKARFPWSDIDYSKVVEAREKADTVSPSDYEDFTVAFDTADNRYYHYVGGKIESRSKSRKVLEQLIIEKHGSLKISAEVTR